ncbi:MAG: hypothetical protein ACYC3L_11695 [Gemmatimonadaceae bacterium]
MRLSRTLVNWVVAIAIGASLATYQMAPQWHAWWGLMDDAEFLGWAPPGRSLRAGEYLATLRSTELGAIGTTTRFRPVYYALRAGERVLWPPSPAWYYAARTVMLAVALSLGAWALFTALGRIVGAGTFALVSTEWYWRDIWAHGGPAEQYAFVGTSLLAVAGAMAWTDQRTARTRGLALLASAGTVLAMGSKENFLILLFPYALLMWHLAKSPAHRRTVVTLFVLVSACAAVIVAVVLPGLRAAGADMYGHTIGAGSRFAWLSAGTGRRIPAAIVLIALLLPIVSWRALPRERRTMEVRARHAELARRLYVHAGLLLLLVVSQLVFYAPTWPTFGGRYDFPGMLAYPLGFAALTTYLLHWMVLAGAGPRATRRMALAAMLAAVAVAGRHGMLPVRDAAELNTRYTQALRTALASLVHQANPGGRQAPIIVEWQAGDEVEPAMSVMRLLYESGSKGPFFLRPAAGAPTHAPLAEFARTGATGPLWKGVTVQPSDALPAALVASGGVAMVVTLDGYAVPHVRKESGR